MSNTGFDWEPDWYFAMLENQPSVPIEDVILLIAGNVEDTLYSEPINLDVKAGCEVAVEVGYSNHAQAPGTGTSIYVLRKSISDTKYETLTDGPWGVMLNYTQAGINRKTFSIDPGSISSFKLAVRNTNSTAGNTVSVTIRYHTADIPAAT